MPLHGRGRLLDFGCGNGSFLERMHRQGWQVTGLDTSGPMVERIQTELGALRAEVLKRLDILDRGVRSDRLRSEVAPKVPGALNVGVGSVSTALGGAGTPGKFNP